MMNRRSRDLCVDLPPSLKSQIGNPAGFFRTAGALASTRVTPSRDISAFKTKQTV
jgi:hypothetical protein